MSERYIDKAKYDELNALIREMLETNPGREVGEVHLQFKDVGVVVKTPEQDGTATFIVVPVPDAATTYAAKQKMVEAQEAWHRTLV